MLEIDQSQNEKQVQEEFAKQIKEEQESSILIMDDRVQNDGMIVEKLHEEEDIAAAEVKELEAKVSPQSPPTDTLAQALAVVRKAYEQKQAETEAATLAMQEAVSQKTAVEQEEVIYNETANTIKEATSFYETFMKWKKEQAQ